MSSELQLCSPRQSMVAPSGERLQGKDAGLAESNGSLPPGDDLTSHLRSDSLYTGISSKINAL